MNSLLIGLVLVLCMLSVIRADLGINGYGRKFGKYDLDTYGIGHDVHGGFSKHDFGKGNWINYKNDWNGYGHGVNNFKSPNWVKPGVGHYNKFGNYGWNKGYWGKPGTYQKVKYDAIGDYNHVKHKIGGYGYH